MFRWIRAWATPLPSYRVSGGGNAGKAPPSTGSSNSSGQGQLQGTRTCLFHAALICSFLCHLTSLTLLSPSPYLSPPPLKHHNSPPWEEKPITTWLPPPPIQSTLLVLSASRSTASMPIASVNSQTAASTENKAFFRECFSAAPIMHLCCDSAYLS